VLQMGDVQAIRYLHHGQGWPKKRIARELRLPVKTVRRALRSESPGEYRLADPRARPITGPIERVIEQLLDTEAKERTQRKQRLTAARIEEILRKQHGFEGGEASVRRAVARVRERLRDPLAEAYVPLAYEPGVDCQVDFLEADVDYPRERQRRHFLLMRACYSGKPFLYHAPDETQEALFDGLLQGFEYFGGVFRHLWFDNLTLAVAKVLKSRSREVQVRFGAFTAHHGFLAEFCGVGLGNEKGGVEHEVRFAQQHCLSPIPKVGGDEELTAWTRVWSDEQDGRKPSGRDAIIGELWAEEVTALMPLPERRFDACRTATRRVSGYSLVQDGANFYSVPVHLAKRLVTLKRYAWTVELHDDSGLVARHKRLQGRGQVSFQLAHYLPLLARKVRAFDRAAPVRAERGTWPPSYEVLLRVMRTQKGDAKGTREFIEVLQLHEHYTVEWVHEAVHCSVAHVEPSLATVRRELDRITGKSDPPAPLAEDLTAHLPSVPVDIGDVSAYGALCQVVVQ
jgi:transposase